MAEAAIRQMASFFCGSTEADNWAPFEFTEADGSTSQFGEVIIFRMEGSTGRTLAVGLWRAPDGKSPVYTSELGDETFLVLSGEAVIRNVDTGETCKVGTGEVCSWSSGSPTEWELSGNFKKFFVVAQT